MLDFLGKLLDSNEREINKLKPLIEVINGLEKKISKLTTVQLKDKFSLFKKEYEKGKSLDDLLPEVFATVREAAKRTIGERHFDVQLLAAAVLHQGKIAEQKTGEGKTLSAAPTLFLNAIAGKGVHLITVNDYLARRDCGWMGPIYHALGASCATIVHEEAYLYDPKYKETVHDDKRLQHLRPITRRQAYEADITYGTNNEFGFDYLRDNMVHRLSDQVQTRLLASRRSGPDGQGGHFFAVVDEVDSILIDEARTPLIISAPAEEPTEKYYQFAKLVDNLSADTDYVVDEKLKSANLTEHGVLKIEKILGVENLYEKDFSTLHHLEQALKAKTLFQKDRDYVVKEGEVIIVDEFTGRLMLGRRYSEGLHQAIEAKENVQIQQESKTLATISFQNYFRMYQKLAGMTGTAATEAEEFHKIYKLDVVIILTHRQMIREDLPDAIYKSQTAKYSAVAELVSDLHQKGQPVLVGTTSIEKNEFLSELIKRKGIPHALLNAKNHEKEAEIISRAGERGVVTVATNMAGRGVDIKLGKGTLELGGLYVIGTERHESRRIDNQLRGRSGRQGDAGTSHFFVSLEDDLMRIFGGEQVSKVMDFLKMPEDVPIEHSMVSKAIEGAQKKVEGHNFDIRKHTVEYDDVMNQQRQIIYDARVQVLKAAQFKDDTLKKEILDKVEKEINNIILSKVEVGVDTKKIVEEFTTIVLIDGSTRDKIEKQVKSYQNTDQVIEFLTSLSKEAYYQLEERIGQDNARDWEVIVCLDTMDILWTQHLDTMDDLRAGIGLRGYAGRDPLIEYKREAFDLFEKMMMEIDFEIVHRIFKVAMQGQARVQMGNMPQGVEIRPQVSPVILEGAQRPIESQEGETKVTIERGGQVIGQEVLDSGGSIHHQKIGRNDPCYCGSGKKYKKCHYPN